MSSGNAKLLVILISFLMVWVTSWLILNPNLRKIQYEKSNPISIIFHSFGILSSARLIHFLLLWLKEYNCICNVERKDFFHVVEKFSSGSNKQLLLSIFGLLISIVSHFYFRTNLDVFVLGLGTIIFAYYYLMQEPNHIEISSILENDNINIGCGAAQQYFNGYLKFIMSEEKNGWRTRLAKYKMYHKVDVYPKLVVLLPESCQTRNLLVDDESVPKMRMANSLEPLVTDRSGIKRIFESTVYAIDERIWVVAEYVPPLSTFCKMLESGTAHVFDASNRREQYVLFCQHLKKLVEQDADCAETCLLVQYDDKKEPSLSQVIVKSIEDDRLQRGRAAG